MSTVATAVKQPATAVKQPVTAMKQPATAMKQPVAAGLRKAAILLITLGEETSAAILRELSPAEIEVIVQKVAQLGSVSADERQEVIRTFLSGMVSGNAASFGGPGAAEKLLAKAFDPEKATLHMATLRERLAAKTEDEFEFRNADPQQLARVLVHEHPQAVAVYLSQLDSERRAAILGAFAAPLRVQVVLRLANLQQVSHHLANQVVTGVEEKLRRLMVGSQESFSGRKAVADLCNQLPPDESDELLEQLAQEDPALADEVRGQMFKFEDILKLDQTAMGQILQRVDRKGLTMGLKGTSEEMKAHFMQQMSQRAKSMLIEDMAALGPVRIRDVQEAQMEVVAIIREMDREGVISLRGGEAESFVT